MESQVKLPAAVRRQVERVKQIEREASEEAPPNETPQAGEQPSQEGQQSKAERPDEGRDEGQAAPKQPDARENDPAYWKQRFSSTMGILRREREDRIATERKLADEIAALKAELAKAREAARGAGVDLSEYLTAEQIEELGEQKALELVELARKVAEAEVKRRIEDAVAPLEDRQRREQESKRREMAQRFHDDLTEAVPGWQDINRTEEWLAFLGEVDDRTGLIRQEIVDIAQSRWDARPIIGLLREHLAALGMSAQGASKPKVAPSSSASSGAAPAADDRAARRVLSPAELKRRYTEIAVNKRLSEKERMKQLAELDEMYRQSQALR